MHRAKRRGSLTKENNMDRKTKFATIGLFTAIILLIFSFSSSEQKQKKSEPKAETVAPAVPPLSHREYADKQMQIFWNENFGHQLEQLNQLTQTMPEIHQRLLENQEAISKRFGKNLEIRLQMAYEKNKNIMQGAQVENGAPRLVIVLPNVLNLDDLLRKEVKEYRKEVLQISVLVGMLHELDHLRYNPPEHLQKDSPLSAEGLAAGEKQAWGYTCRYTIAPLIERYGKTLSPNALAFYRDWVDSDRDENSKAWEERIRKVYNSFHND